MKVFGIAILSAFTSFPFIAFLFTLPFLIYNYRKFGAIPWLKILVIYSFVLYLLNIYCLIILPFPSSAQARNLHGVKMQLIPFMFIKDFLTETDFDLFNPQTYISTIKSSAVYVVAFNLIMFMPLGIYLRYYFKFSLLKTFFISLGISLFFEITQLTGLYGIYNGSYRLFDVDDLIVNSTGGALGYIIAPIFTFFLPSKNEIDIMSYEKGKHVSVIREIIAWCTDFFIMMTVSLFIIIFFPGLTMVSISLISFIFVIILPIKISGNTIGQRFMKYRTISTKSTKLDIWQIFVRNLLIFYVILPTPLYLFFALMYFCISFSYFYTFVFALAFFILGLMGIAMVIQMVIRWIKDDNTLLFYEKISNTKNISTI
ncbi:hypothetical protein AN640_07970 [Candidatus Epulonipiscium fishelsonii]|uniref:Uncharacterized protein n=1 Tax=Candidatus Epulonipiscium fishelsonii TaxID=77094 RepID=A0ACC8XEF2_9FIRM|nr:hypothetical protein AN640_07970 [Epulopiscium sp. SCG-D08WGA-EpuloA1]